MHVITRRMLLTFPVEHPDSRTHLTTDTTRPNGCNGETLWRCVKTYPPADSVKDLTVFDIGGNKYRLITRINYASGRIYIVRVMTHAEYSKEDWKR